jgi:hypothetical protein
VPVQPIKRWKIDRMKRSKIKLIINSLSWFRKATSAEKEKASPYQILAATNT